MGVSTLLNRLRDRTLPSHVEDPARAIRAKAARLVMRDHGASGIVDI
jgi:hypothetical protein